MLPANNSQARTTEKAESITSGLTDATQSPEYDPSRLAYAHVDGPSVSMAYMADDKGYVSISYGL